MSTVIIDDELKARLNGLTQHVELRDASGKAVARCVPEDEYQAILRRTEEFRESLRQLTSPPNS